MARISWKRLVLIALLLTGAALPILFGGQDAFAILSDISVYSIFFLFFTMLVLSVINSVRLRILFGDAHASISPLAFFRLYLATELASKITPGGSGALPAALALLRRYKIPPSHSISIFLVSAGLDLLVLGALVFIVVVLGGKNSGWLTSPLTIVLCFFVGVILFAPIVPLFRIFIWQHLKKLQVSAAQHKAPLRWLSAMINALDVFIKNVCLIGFHRTTAAMLVSVIYWCLHLSVLYWVILEMGGQVAWKDSMLVQFAAMGLGHLSLSPGGAGVVEATVIAGLAPWMSVSMASAVVIVWRLFMQYFYIVAGALALFAERMVATQQEVN